MKIVITSSGKSLESQIDSRFGRAAQFTVYDTETGEFQFVENNQNLNAAQGAGIQAAEAVSRIGADCVITGHCGPKAFRTLQAAGIQIITGAQGTVSYVIEEFKAGRLKTSDSPDVEGHWA
ncbi:MAG: NifB/NifX family molybdenum-iron cluster-binding protein [bacterium]